MPNSLSNPGCGLKLKYFLIRGSCQVSDSALLMPSHCTSTTTSLSFIRGAPGTRTPPMLKEHVHTRVGRTSEVNDDRSASPARDGPCPQKWSPTIHPSLLLPV